ncbi:hypothetical protein [Rhizobium sp. L1K21]|uniref:hypothetical protein n=1 Tax=Rhizobium sp. L1K21 TaxID=2954933 RepID=UPI002093ABED|nr:hypothetical protein [Rhizobium sp. L1K21]MCO6185227.1 hypothetical protein [Rhizobium sp. L1K21]
MTDKRYDERRKLVSLADALFDDLFSMSDEEIIAEVREAGLDPKIVADEMRVKFSEASILAGKERMKAAKARLRSAEQHHRTERNTDIAVARQRLRNALSQEGVSMAARNETENELTDEEVLRKYNDLIRLGVIDPESDGDT